MSKNNFLETLLNKTQGSTLWLQRLYDAADFGGRVIRGRQPCDYIGSIEGRPLMVESKETIEDSISISTYLTAAHKKHQFEALLKWAQFYPSHLAGYVAHLGAVTSVLWVPVESIPHIKTISLKHVGTLGIRAIDLSKQRVDWPYLILGRVTDGGPEP